MAIVKSNYDFLTIFHINPILLYNGNLQKSNSPMLVVKGSGVVGKLREAERLNSLGHDIYFIPNPGGTKIDDVYKLVTHFVDLDAGKDNNGKYLSDAKVKTFKRRALAHIKKSPKKPSLIVETRNGYQLYWLLKQPVVSKQSWAIVQNKICNFFKSVGSDSKVLKANQILRVPNFYWQKKYTRLKRFKCVCKTNHVSYTYNELATAFIEQSGKKPASNFNSYKKQSVPVLPQPTHNKDNWDGWDTPVKVPKLTSNLSEEVVDYLAEVQKILQYSGHKYLAKQAGVLQEKLLTGITLNKDLSKAW